jgi:hypothetical protein
VDISSGRKELLTNEKDEVLDLAWSPRGDEIWFTVSERGTQRSVREVSLGRSERTLGTVIGVLEPSVPYPQDTEIIANLVMSPHHLSATMVAGRVHRMTELFGRLAPGATLDQARTELRTSYASMTKDHADAYPAEGQYTISARMLRD